MGESGRDRKREGDSLSGSVVSELPYSLLEGGCCHGNSQHLTTAPRLL